MQASPRPVRILRVIARLNVGGPAIQAITLTSRMRSLGYDTTLVRGSEGPREGSMDELARQLYVNPVRIPWLRRELGLQDVRALAALLRHIRRLRPDIVHTHAAKAGTLGRLAVTACRHRPVTVHTFHGHVLEGYFSGPKAALFRRIERWLAARTTRLVTVSTEVRDDLVRLGIAPADRITVVPLGFELDRFALPDPSREQCRRSFRDGIGIDPRATLITLVARLVPIKRVDRFLRLACRLAEGTDAHFLIVGDGELHDRLRATPAALRLGGRLTWRGFTSRIESVYFASDVVVLTSDNEGTPVSLIEAHAAGLPVVSTDVGGVRSVVQDGRTGYVRQVDDDEGLAAAVSDLILDPSKARRFGAAGQAHVTRTFTLDRLVGDLDRLYRDLLAEARA